MPYYVLRPEQMSRADHRTIEELGVPSRVLMELAGKEAAKIISAEYPAEVRRGALVFCGTGNNGGDGAVIARWLFLAGYPVTLVFGGEGELSPDNRANLDICGKLGIKTVGLSEADEQGQTGMLFAHHGIIVDAIFGTGYRDREDPRMERLFAAMNAARAPRIAIDIPSGLAGDGSKTRASVRADATLAIEALKPAHIIRREACGKLFVIPIGIPESYLREEQGGILIDAGSCSFPYRSPQGHKGSNGEVAIFAGTPGMSGAAILAGKAVLRAGAGYARLYHHPELTQVYGAQVPEIMPRAVPLNAAGRPELKALGAELGEPEVILFGPGMGQGDYCAGLLRYVIEETQTPLVIDADGLNVLAKDKGLISRLRGRKAVLTPHWGEFCRLAGIGMDALGKDPLGELERYVAATGLSILLKSHYSIYRDPERLYYITAGNDGLATGGSGDVLSGIIASFMAQGASPALAAANGAFLLGFTAEQLAERRDTAAIMPSDVIEHLFEDNNLIDYKEKRCRD